MAKVKLENRCSNCSQRRECRDRGAVVEWKNCKDFKVDLVIMAAKAREQAEEAARRRFLRWV